MASQSLQESKATHDAQRGVAQGVRIEKPLHGYTVISCKCPRCSLRFKIYTEQEQLWRDIKSRGLMLRATCPECGELMVHALTWHRKAGFISDEFPDCDPAEKESAAMLEGLTDVEAKR